MSTHPCAYKSKQALDTAAAIDAAMVIQIKKLDPYITEKGRLGSPVSTLAYFECRRHPTEAWRCYMVPDDLLGVMPKPEMTEEEADKAFGLTDPFPEEVAASQAEVAEPGLVARTLSAVANLFRWS